MTKRKPSGEVRVLVGSGYLAGDKDMRDAGPIPKSAGVEVVTKASIRKAKTPSRTSVRTGRKKKT